MSQRKFPVATLLIATAILALAQQELSRQAEQLRSNP